MIHHKPRWDFQKYLAAKRLYEYLQSDPLNCCMNCGHKQLNDPWHLLEDGAIEFWIGCVDIIESTPIPEK